ncbi:MAG: hypothetical protein JKY65_02950 [Planctomycetes bacterium]|nr:hypothetical protein [Planctomycetota bacterium]
MADEQEIISRPPSHPIATTLLLVSMIGTGLAISLVWQELFGEYLPSDPGGGAQTISSKNIAENGTRNHYEKDFKGSDKNLMADIEKELKIKGGDAPGGDLSTPSGRAGDDDDGHDDGHDE